jgi:hypothetical protein
VRPSAFARAIVSLVMSGALALVACGSTSSSPGPSSPNEKPGQCVLRGEVWYCGTGYGNFPACPTELTEDTESGSCTYDGGTCFACLYGPAGATCTCEVATTPDSGAGVDGGVTGPTWSCVPSETGCGP